MKGDTLCGEEGGENVPTVGRKGVAVGGVDLVNEAMGAEQAKLTGNASGAATFFFDGVGGRIVEKGLQIAVAQTVDGEFAMTDGFKERGVFLGPGAEGPHAFVFPGGGLTKAANHLADRNRCVNGGESVEVTIIGSLRNLGATVDIGDAFAHREPVFGAGGMIFGVAKDFKNLRGVDGGFNAQDGTLFVIEFDGVLTQAMLDANALRTIFKVGDNFALEGAMDLSSEETHDIGAGESGHAMMDKRGVYVRQGGAVFEHDIGGPFALMDGPVIVHGSVFEKERMGGVEEPSEFVEGFGPVEIHLLVHEGLGFGGVAQLGEAVVPTAVGKAFAIHGSRQPFAAVETDLDREGQPALNAGVHEAEEGVDQVMIECQTFTETRNEFQFLNVPVAMDIETATGLDTGEDSDQSGGDPVALGDLASESFFVGIAGRKILDGPPLFASGAQGRVLQLSGQTLGVGPKIFQKNLVAPEKPFDPFDVGNGTQGPPQDQTVESAQDPGDSILMMCYKMVHGVLLKKNVFANIFYFIEDAVSIVRQSFGCGYAAL